MLRRVRIGPAWGCTGVLGTGRPADMAPGLLFFFQPASQYLQTCLSGMPQWNGGLGVARKGLYKTSIMLQVLRVDFISEFLTLVFIYDVI